MKKSLFLLLAILFIFNINDVHALTENFTFQEVYMAFCEINSSNCSGQGTTLPGIIYSNQSYGFQDVGEYHFQGGIDLDPSYQYTVTIDFNPYFDNFYENVWNNQIFTLKLYQSNNEVPVTYKSIHVTRPDSTYWVSIQVTFVPMLKANHFSFRINTNRSTGDQLIMPPQEIGGILGDFGSMNVEKVTYSATDQKLDNINQSILGSSAVITGSLDDLKNQQQQTTNAIKENNETNKNIFQKILELPATILNAIVDGLKSLFIPSNDFFENFINDFKDNFLNKLGFLAYPFELIGDILGRYMNITTNPVINIPQINEPFTGGKIISATSVNLQTIFETGAIGTLYTIYMSFASVIIIFMFLNYAIKKFNEFVKNKGDGN